MRARARAEIDRAVEADAGGRAAGEPAGGAAVDQRMRDRHHVATRERKPLGRHLPYQPAAVVDLAGGLEVTGHRRLRAIGDAVEA